MESTLHLRPPNSSEVVVSDMNNETMTGTEKYPITGNLLLEHEAAELIQKCSGLLLSANCIEKAKVVIQNRAILSQIKNAQLKLCVGAIRVWSTDMRSGYGHDFVPPRELHSWVEVDNTMIIDISLPGVIMRGRNCFDEEGQVLTGRFPEILAGKIPYWITYKTAGRF